jgi:hypothetical protein
MRSSLREAVQPKQSATRHNAVRRCDLGYARWPLSVRGSLPETWLEPAQPKPLLEKVLVAKKQEDDGGADNLGIPTLLEECWTGRTLPTP